MDSAASERCAAFPERIPVVDAYRTATEIGGPWIPGRSGPWTTQNAGSKMNLECLRCGKDVQVGHSPKTRSGKQIYVRQNSGFHGVGVLCYDCLKAIGGEH